MVSGLSSSVRRTSRKAASLRPKICGAREGIANWCSEWKKRCWERWPCVIVRSARPRSTRDARRADVRAPRGDERVGQPAGVAPAVARGELRDVAMVVAQLLPELLARDVQQRVQPPLVVGDPVVVDPRLGRQPVRRRVGRGQRVVGLRGGRRGDQREHGEDERRDPAHARFYTASGARGQGGGAGSRLPCVVCRASRAARGACGSAALTAAPRGGACGLARAPGSGRAGRRASGSRLYGPGADNDGVPPKRHDPRVIRIPQPPTPRTTANAPRPPAAVRLPSVML